MKDCIFGSTKLSTFLVHKR